ncbi:hypothetical protein SNOG_16447 [Parastagonospora nodorum SN15]|uniref:Initiator tRNA phosphoribosyl transferase n=1 Tax=Phaeosphaeria nodorum (strain SN15 / ATCC MYA-4574 / FGSC 10173) TaxID=321614 RepID=Q0TVL7_PHANO|nr:hypothetical protein SNOG_16447 [Parastagonospora nodorum SN15]EAT76145.2 hypothetical protein SNOG_16447 [Parastagonospora nodorum SN15]
MAQPLSEADILFPHLANNPNFSSTLSSLKRSALSIHNRLTSIISDSEFVASVSEAYRLPLVANERCGSWYIPLERKAEGVYFKSTDGHMSQWGFSLRRLNLQLLDVVQNHGGAVVVDSTRRGKSMPDALSKTIPIWCCVINRAVFGAEGQYAMYTPPQAVSSSEHAQIASRIDGFVAHFLTSIRLFFAQHHGASKALKHQKAATFKALLMTTKPGAMDSHRREEDAPDVVAKLLEEESQNSTDSTATLVKPTTSLYISPSQNVDLNRFDVVVSCTPEPLSSASLKEARIKHYLPLKCQSGKLGSRDLRNELPVLQGFLSSLPAVSSLKVLVTCPTGKDLSVGTALAILCLHTDESGHIDLSTRRGAAEINKNFIKQRLSWITTSNPALNPSRTTLQSVNSVLLTTQDPKVMNGGLKFNARRKYVYQLIDDAVVVKFFDDEKFPRAKVEDGVGKEGEGIGGMFVEMDTLVVKEASSGEVAAKNKEQHLCAEDLYSASWRFNKGMTGGEGPMWWEVRYDVKGPKKDYISSTRYERSV